MKSLLCSIFVDGYIRLPVAIKAGQRTVLDLDQRETDRWRIHATVNLRRPGLCAGRQMSGK